MKSKFVITVLLYRTKAVLSARERNDNPYYEKGYIGHIGASFR